MARLRDLNDGQAFLFPECAVVQEARGGGFYGKLGGHDGGPWHTDRNPEVIPAGPGTGIPAKNYWVNQVSRDHTDVELRGLPRTQYYVATIDGVEGVVCMDGQHQLEQQKFLDQCVAATIARRTRGIPAEDGRPKCRSPRSARSCLT